MRSGKASRTLSLVGCAALLLWAPGCGSRVEAAESAAPRYVVTATGRLDSATETRYLVAERDAVIRTVHVRPGESVHEGDALVDLACDDALAGLDSARGQQTTARSRLELLESGPLPSEIARLEAQVDEAAARWSDSADALRRQEALGNQGYAAERALVHARSEEEARRLALASGKAALKRLRRGAREEERRAARGQLETAKARVGLAAAEVRKCTVVAPTDGTVLRVFHRAGEFSGASQGQPLIAFADLRSMIVRAEVDERDVPDVVTGMTAEVWIDGRPERWRGSVVQVASLMGRRTARTLDPADRFDRDTLEVLVALENASAPRQVGLRVTVGLGASGPERGATPERKSR